MDSTPRHLRLQQARKEWNFTGELIRFHKYAQSAAERCNDDGDYVERDRWTKCVHATEQLLDAYIDAASVPHEPQNHP